jgi:hypothetical protein
VRAVVIHEYGGPEVLKLEERPEPQVRDAEILCTCAPESNLARRYWYTPVRALLGTLPFNWQDFTAAG